MFAAKANTPLSAWTTYTICNSGAMPSAYRPKTDTKFIISQSNGAGELVFTKAGSVTYKPWYNAAAQYAYGGQVVYRAQ